MVLRRSEANLIDQDQICIQELFTYIFIYSGRSYILSRTLYNFSGMFYLCLYSVINDAVRLRLIADAREILEYYWVMSFRSIHGVSNVNNGS